jgi:hypothetical protein
VCRHHVVEFAVDRFLEQQDVVGRALSEQPARLEILDEAVQIPRPLMQVPCDDGKDDRGGRDAKGRARGAAAERQRERAEDESRDVAV